jgi:hypothetical protein
MKLFGQLVRTVVNTAALPVAVVHDMITLGGTIDEHGEPHTLTAVKRLKREAAPDAGKEG